MVKLTELTKEEYFTYGHRLCAGCGAAIIMRQALKGIRGPTVICHATGCVEVASTIYPYNAWKLPWVHVAFECAGALVSGVEAAYKAAQKKTGEKVPDFLVFGGDGSSFDIGIQSLSGAMERGHDFLYICYDNEAYMNTGIQRSGATPHGAATTTSPAGTKIPGKREWKKDLVKIAVAHDIEYAATASPSNWNDFITKVRKGLEVKGPALIHVLSPCPLGWRSEPSQSIRIADLAVKTRIFPIYEVIDGQYKLNIPVKTKLPVEEYLKTQGRFKHLFSDEFKGEIVKIQENVDKNWDKLLKLCGEA